MCACISTSLRNTRKTFNKFLYFRTNVIEISRSGIYVSLFPKLLDAAQFVLKHLTDIFPGASMHWNISLGNSVLVYWFVPKKLSCLTDAIH